MSINYEIKERLTIAEANETTAEFQELVADHICAVGGRILAGLGSVGRIRIEADLREFELSEDSALKAWTDCVEAVRSCSRLSMETFYSYAWKSDLPECDNVGPFALMVYANGQDGKFLESVLYESYNYADNTDPNNAGNYCAFGYKDKVRYNGNVPFVRTDKVPACDWYNPGTPLVLDNISVSETGQEILTACRELDMLCDINDKYPNLKSEGSSIEYSLNNLHIRSQEDAVRFAKPFSALLRYLRTDKEEVFFRTQNSDEMALLKLTVLADGSFAVEVAAL